MEAARKKAKPEDVFHVFDDNWEVVLLFCRMATQWRIVVGMAGAIYQGIDYTALEAVMRMNRVKDRGRMWGGIQIMERAALEVLNSGNT